jgi:ABC-2 type transport system permease protein
LDVISTAASGALEFAILALALNRFGGIAGWSLAEVAFLYGLVEFSFGLMDLLFSGVDPPVVSGLIRTGALDAMLLRPVRLFVQFLGNDLVLRRLGRMVQGAAIFGLALWLNPVEWTGAKLAYLPVVVAAITAFNGALFIAGAAICFWTVQQVEVVNLFTYGGVMMQSYPQHIYPQPIRLFFTYIIPGALMVYYPALFFLDKPDPLGAPLWFGFLAPAIAVLALLAAIAFFRLGLRHYASTGS